MAHRTAPAAEIRAAVGPTVTQRIVRNRLPRTAPNKKACNVHSTDSKPLSFVKPLLSSQSSLDYGSGSQTFTTGDPIFNHTFYRPP
ncbi:hypothetical protein TNCV_2151991 [Trichonephila clavipes]|nr:hypothetical protein TNCV_2151991 [Trichonephila clavipes]